MKKCIHCGAEVPEEEAVCPACGQSVTEEAQTSENQQAQPETEKGPETDEDTCEEKTDPQEDGAQEPAAETPAAAAPAQKKAARLGLDCGRAGGRRDCRGNSHCREKGSDTAC